jgi:hypothetical protein
VRPHRLKIIVIAFFLTQGVSGRAADLSPIGREDFCRKMSQPGFVQEALSTDKSTHLAFDVRPTKWGIWSCWWNARIQRAFSYLAVYRPDLPRPTKSQARRIIKRITQRRAVTEIPGYANLWDFSRAWEATFYDYIADWQLGELLLLGWINGVNPDYESTTETKVRETIDEIYRKVTVDRWTVHVLIQYDYKAEETHAINIIGGEKTGDGFRFEVVDNYIDFEEPIKYAYYSFGDSVLRYEGFEGPPYIKFESHQKDFRTLRRKYCEPSQPTPESARTAELP